MLTGQQWDTIQADSGDFAIHHAIFVAIVFQHGYLTAKGTEATEKLKDQWLTFYWRYSLVAPRDLQTFCDLRARCGL